jgi:UDP-N-acetylmuramoyl-L-alanyl-D-glutamate--2,6-diaminopimelate ligase
VKLINEILKEIPVEKMTGDKNIPIADICFDSRKVSKGSMFVAVKGTQTDGHKYIDQAISQGTVAIVCEDIPVSIITGITYIKVADTAATLGLMSSNFYDNPSSKLKLVGITGTNGKTTTATLLYKLFRQAGYKSGLLSTVGYYIDEKAVAATHTTPDSLLINNLLNDMIVAGCKSCFMEVSSHAIVQKRITGLNFTGGVFTNITHDHLDYHRSFDKYLNAKKSFFDSLPAGAFALTNTDDRHGRVMVQNTHANIKTYALKSAADFKCRVLEKHFDGMLLSLNNKEIWTKLTGGFNAQNILAVYASAVLSGLIDENILPAISNLDPVEGRFETLRSSGGITVIVDYAHTPDAVKNVLSTINELITGSEKVITVIGAGGDRDKTKRPTMAKTAVELSSKVIFTSDNPRSENPEHIIADMMKGIDIKNKNRVLTITDRSQAIKTACMMADKNDIILIAGKGHENYQEINGIKFYFDDREEVKKNLEIIN